MKLIIAGKRTIEIGMYHMEYIVNHFNLEPKEIVSGAARGIDYSGEQFSVICKGIGLKKFPADWNKYGNAAGPIRNRQMANYADALLLIWDGVSRGSSNMKQEMLSLKKPVYEVILKSHNIEEEEL